MSLCYSRDGKYLACASIDGIVNIFKLDTNQLLHKIEGMFVCVCAARALYVQHTP